MSNSGQQIILGKGFVMNPLLSIYSASMVGVFCTLIMVVDAPLPAIFVLAALLLSYLATCIFIFGGFRRYSGDDVGTSGAGLHLGVPSGFVILFCLSSLAALFGTYSALDPIAGPKSEVSELPQNVSVNLRFKRTGDPQVKAPQQRLVSQVVVAKPETIVPVSSEIKPDLTLEFGQQKPILASVRSDDLVGERSIRSHAWEIRETANLPELLKLPTLLFSILYGDDAATEIADMVVAKRESGSSARIMVSFLTTPEKSFKNHPVVESGGTLVVRKQAPVVQTSSVVESPEPVTVVQKTEPDTAANTTLVVAQLAPKSAMQDPVAVSSTKQDLQRVERRVSEKSRAVRSPDVLLPPVLASIFFGPSSLEEAPKLKKRAPRLTTLFKTNAPQAVRLLDAEPLTVVAKSPDARQVRHPIALAALADSHRMDPPVDESLGGPFSVVHGSTRELVSDVNRVADVSEPAVVAPRRPLITGSIPSTQVDTATRSLSFAPRASETRYQNKQERSVQQHNAKSDLGATNVLATRTEQKNTVGNEESLAVPASSGNRPVTIIWKKEAAAAQPSHKVAQVNVPVAGVQTGVSDVAARRTDDVVQAAVPKARRAPLSAAAMRKANEEINSALRDAEADLKDTDVLLGEIDVIWKDHDKQKNRRTKPDNKASLTPPAAEDTVVIRPASVTGGAGAEDVRSTVPARLVLKLMAPSKQHQQAAGALDSGGHTPPVAASDGARQLLGYIREQGSLNQRGKFVDCAVLGPDSKLRACQGRSVTRL